MSAHSVPGLSPGGVAAAGEPAAAALVAGRHRRKFVEDGDRYDRICRVEAKPGGTLSVKAPGTTLNPGVGFQVALTGAAPTCGATARRKTFATRRGRHAGAAVVEEIGGADGHVLRFRKGCAIWNEAEAF